MKKIKFLIPLVGIGSVATIATPMVSCSNATIFDAYKDLNVTNWSICSDPVLATQDALVEYEKACQSNNSIVKNDYIYGRHILAKKMKLIIAELIKDLPGGNADTTGSEIERCMEDKSFLVSCSNIGVSTVNGVVCEDLQSQGSGEIIVNAEAVGAIDPQFAALFSKYDVTFSLDFNISMEKCPMTIMTLDVDPITMESLVIPLTMICNSFFMNVPVDINKLSPEFRVDTTISFSTRFYDKINHKVLVDSPDVFGLENTNIELHINHDNAHWYLLTTFGAVSQTSFLHRLIFSWASYYFSRTEIAQ